MSSFMCCPETIYDVARCVVYFGFTHKGYLSTDYKKSWQDVFGIEKKDTRKIQIRKVYRKLINLNILALKEFNQDYEDMVGDLDSYNHPMSDVTFKPSYKVAIEMRCFIYQCCEGKSADTDEYHIVAECFRILCCHLVDMECRNREAELSKYWA